VEELFVLVMAGGRGTRFWPKSRRHKPKQVLPLLPGGRSILEATIDRLEPLVPAERMLVITGRDMEADVRAVLHGRIPTANVLVEPHGRNTAPAIGWGAVEIGRRSGGTSVMAVLPSDHMVARPEELLAVLQAAARAALDTNALVTLGMQPTRPETGFGYLEVGVQVGTWGGRSFHGVERFVEKPNADTARRYVAGGRHLWNAGMFVFTVDAVRDAYRAYLPETAVVLEQLMIDPTRLDVLWGETEATSIDYGIFERSRHIFTVPCDPGWSDVGSWRALEDFLPETEGGHGLARAVLAHQSRGCVVHAPDHVVALLGVEDLVVVESGGVILVAPKDRSQDVGRLVEMARQRQLDDLI
jgi:mannose-1-phosphate guanylyltransferase